VDLFKSLCEIFYLIPRLLLFSVILVCFLIIVFISFDYLRPYLYPMETFRGWAAHVILG
jgi:hypothetical protein